MRNCEYRLDHNDDWFSISVPFHNTEKNTTYKDTETDKKRQYILQNVE